MKYKINQTKLKNRKTNIKLNYSRKVNCNSLQNMNRNKKKIIQKNKSKNIG